MINLWNHDNKMKKSHNDKLNNIYHDLNGHKSHITLIRQSKLPFSNFTVFHALRPFSYLIICFPHLWLFWISSTLIFHFLHVGIILNTLIAYSFYYYWVKLSFEFILVSSSNNTRAKFFANFS